ncbi:MAG: cbb3-type cytochrome c oxidase subunit I [Gemmatirosa sp.]|nr:cbb3-type cytochrome c oxidase subunit I [Gemmatirosa sp.]
MEWFVKAFLKASLAWLALGVTLGVAMAAHPAWTVYRLAHVHMVLLGFVTMMIYGVAYHVIPRFAGQPLHRRGAAGAHWWTSNAGLALMALGFCVRVHAPALGTPLLAVGGTLSALGAYAFVYLIWRTLDGAAPRRQAMAVPNGADAGGRRLPLAG